MKKSVQSLNKHHRFVHCMRVLLLGLAGMLFILLLTWPQLMKRADMLTSTMKDAINPKNMQAQVDMTKVQFVSEDEKGQPFIVTSEYITEIDPANKLIQLEKPSGEITLESGTKLLCQSPLALFAQDTQVVHFTQGVKVISDNGYTADMFDVVVDYNNQMVRSDNALAVRGEKINLDSLGFVARQNGDMIDFYGPVRVELKDSRRLVITAKKVMHVRRNAQTVDAFGKVMIDDGKNKVYGNTMTASFVSIGQNQFDLRSVTVKGNVHIQTPDENIFGNEAFYDLQKEQAEIQGNVRVEKTQGVLTGDHAFIDMKKGTSRLESDRANNTQRVKGTLLPDKIKKKEK